MAPVVTSARRRVLHVLGGLHVGGAETWLACVRETAAMAGWDTEYCLLDDKEGPLANEFRQAGCRLQHCSLRPFWTFPLRMRRVIRRGEFDVVHSHVLLFSGFITAISALAGVPVRIVHAHNSHDGQQTRPLRRLYRWLMRGSIRWFGTHALACSADATAFLGRAATWLPYGVDLTLFSRPRQVVRRADFGIAGDALVMGHVGSLTKQKNQMFLLRAFAEAAQEEPRLQLVIAGEGPLASALRSEADSLGLADRVRFLGRRTDVDQLLMGLFDGFLLPSRHEGLPVALLEAQAAGLPCLVSDRIGAQAIALPDKVELLPIDAGVAPWAAAIRRLAARGRLPQGQSVRRMRNAGFDSSLSGARLVEFYASAALSS
jgi:glycosyltransferase involved in cell wall biosynthesis